MPDRGIVVYTLTGERKETDLPQLREDVASLLRDTPDAEELRVKVSGHTDARTLSALSDLAEDHRVRLRFDTLDE